MYNVLFFFYLFYTDVYFVARMFITYPPDYGRKLSQLACRKCEYKGENFVHSQEVIVHYIEVFCTIGTKNSVHCSELGGVHYVKVYLQQKSIGGDRDMHSNRRCSLYRGVHSWRFYCILYDTLGSTLFRD
jgi:hypothetical protein